ncbi:MAG TPA: prepilin-type N-terminal cleavage/methylation domain-containing protein [Oligoflexia bacterium]|nr:prepilin-type N-terminal cleavage/methylation domain-containing protein [Oligoflexia bacterium]HMP47933.1 prepilin-type N-terminal cleavage/methylation domain-containing protein [Oligoflexia bacterium]
MRIYSGKTSIYRVQCDNSGFTLIEIAIAIAIFGIALSTLMATTTRLIDTSYSELQRSRAAIFASYLFEVALHNAQNPQQQTQSDPGRGTSPNDIQITNQSSTLRGIIPAQSGRLIDRLNNSGFFEGLDVNRDFPFLNHDWHFNLVNEPLDLPLLSSPPQHITITVSWGNQNSDSYVLETIVPPPKNIPGSAGSNSNPLSPGIPNNQNLSEL